MSNHLLVLQSDFGLVDGAVSAMIGGGTPRGTRS